MLLAVCPVHLCTGTCCYVLQRETHSTACFVIEKQMLCRCLVFTKRLCRAKQALAKSFSQVSVASATFQHWRKLACLSSRASAAASTLRSLDHLGSLAALEGSTPDWCHPWQAAVNTLAHSSQTDSAAVTVTYFTLSAAGVSTLEAKS